jgi:hypothetical protein
MFYGRLQYFRDFKNLPAQFMQMKTPKSKLTQRGPFAPQSAHSRFSVRLSIIANIFSYIFSETFCPLIFIFCSLNFIQKTENKVLFIE